MSSDRLVKPEGQISSDFGELGEGGTTPDPLKGRGPNGGFTP
jgi:hypothetical protein